MELAFTHLLCSLQPLLCPHQLIALGRHVGTLLCRVQESYLIHCPCSQCEQGHDASNEAPCKPQSC